MEDNPSSSDPQSRRSRREPSRRSYRPVSSAEAMDEEEGGSPTSLSPAIPSLSVRQTRRQRRAAYQSVSAQDDEETSDSASVSSSTSHTSKKLSKIDSFTKDSSLPAPNMTLILLDGFQTKFKIPAHPDWTVAHFKVAGSFIHKVPVSGQRLVFRGKLLADDQTLASAGITTDTTIVHLFPKPRVVLSDTTSPACAIDGSLSASGESTQGADSGGGAHVPTIVLNADEAERRSQILVLGSVEYMEAQSNVKLFSFMLMMISTMELLNLLAIFMGVPQEEAGASQGGGYSGGLAVDDIFINLDDDMYTRHGSHPNETAATNASSPHSGGYDGTNPYLPLEQNPWGWINMVDLALSILGVYVALIGIRAASETRLVLARLYLTGTVAVGIGWMLFNYYLTVQMDEAMQEDQIRDYEEKHGQNDQPTNGANGGDDDGLVIMSDEDIYKSALSVMVLPGLVWFMCCLRAAQFHNLLRDAELEAATRIQSQMTESDDIASTNERSSNRSEEGQNEDNSELPRLPAVV